MATTALIILDGYGVSAQLNGNAVKLAKQPYIDFLFKNYPHTLISASGLDVGLPAGQMGNSEVGHLNIGSGRVVYQDITRIDNDIKTGEFFSNTAFLGAIENCKKNNTALHLVGLTSNGGVHTSINHLFALIDLAAQHNLKKVFIHCLTDGRDVPPTSGASFVQSVVDKCKASKTGTVVSAVGRFFYMDRDNRWERVKKGYDLVMSGVGTATTDVVDAIKQSYVAGITDEFLEPVVLKGYEGVKPNDSIIFFNFRTDRAREITRAITFSEFDKFERIGGYKPTYYVCFTVYDATFNNVHVAFSPKSLKNTLGEYLANNGKTQARIAETEKYAHVTFFFNGGVEAPNKNETRVLVPSPKVLTYDLKPEMSACEVADRTIEVLENGVDTLILNFANPDMLGHTGNIKATVAALETVDKCLKRVVEKVLSLGGRAIVTADHGNAECMLLKDGSPCTSHTTNLVPLVVVDNKLKNTELKEGGRLCDIAPTMLKLMGMPIPSEMEGASLV